MTPTANKYLSVQATADELGCSKYHVYDLVKSGKLSAIRLGLRKWSISRESLDHFIAENAVGCTPDPADPVEVA